MRREGRSSARPVTAATMAIAAMCVLLACARLPGMGKSAKRQAGTPPDSVFVDVLNEHYYDARIHAVYSGGQRRSLGTIAGNGGRARRGLAWEPRALLFEVVFVTDGSAYVSYPMDVAAGNSIEIRLPSNIDESGFFRRMRRD